MFFILTNNKYSHIIQKVYNKIIIFFYVITINYFNKVDSFKNELLSYEF